MTVDKEADINLDEILQTAEAALKPPFWLDYAIRSIRIVPRLVVELRASRARVAELEAAFATLEAT